MSRASAAENWLKSDMRVHTGLSTKSYNKSDSKYHVCDQWPLTASSFFSILSLIWCRPSCTACGGFSGT